MSTKVIIALIVIFLLIGTISFAASNKKNNAANGVAHIKQLPNEYVAFPLAVGSKGIAVKCIQSYLGVKVDGIFGNQTKFASIDYFFTDDGSITEQRFLNAIVFRNQTQIDEVFPMKLGDSLSFALNPLQIMTGCKITNTFDDETAAAVYYVFGKNEVTYNDYKALCSHVFNLTI